MSETILERKGQDVKASNLAFKVPSDRSVLSLMGGMSRYIAPIENGCDINEDGWVYYPDGRKIKWFSKIIDHNRSDGFFVWAPRLHNIAEIERIRWKILKYHQKWANKAWKLIEEIHEKGGAFANCPNCDTECYHWFPPSIQDIPQFDGSTKAQKSIILKYHEGTGKSPVNLALGNLYYKTEHRMAQIAGWRFNADAALQSALLNIFPNPETLSNGQLKITINSRDYWFHKDYMDHRGKYSWRKLSWPEDEVTHIQITTTTGGDVK